MVILTDEMDIRAFGASAVIPRLAQEDDFEILCLFVLDMEKLVGTLEKHEKEERGTAHFLRPTLSLRILVLLIKDFDDEVAFNSPVIEVFLRRNYQYMSKHGQRGPQT
jgi:hypothetical protein